jgi:hypothetical protein
MLQSTYNNRHLMLINVGEPFQWTNLKNVNKKTLVMESYVP